MYKIFCAVLMMLAGLSGISIAQDRAGADTIKDVMALVKEAVDYYRGKASISTVEMTIHRTDWERTMTIQSWTRGQKESLFFISAPSKDEGNGTLKKGREMWSYNPKINRVIKLPPSMMSQAWMGSDFSNNDLAKSDSILEDYDHSLESVKNDAGLKLYVIRSMPKPAAPVVWGMQKLYVREDAIMVREEFYDEDMALVKTMTGSELKMFGKKLFPSTWQMQKTDSPEEFTRLTYKELRFVENLPDRLFTLSALKNKGR